MAFDPTDDEIDWTQVEGYEPPPSASSNPQSSEGLTFDPTDDEIDWTIVPGYQPPKPQASWTDVFSEVLPTAGRGIVKGIGSVGQLAGDTLGWEGLSNESRALRTGVSEEAADVEKELNLDPLSAKNITLQGLAGTAQYLPMLAAGPLGATAIAAGQAGAEKYADLRDEGLSYNEALGYGTLYGATSGLLERGPFKTIAGPVQSVLKKTGRAALEEGITEPLQEGAEMATDYFATGKVPTPQELATRLAVSAGAGALGGGTVGLGYGAYQKATGDTVMTGEDLSKAADEQAANLPEFPKTPEGDTPYDPRAAAVEPPPQNTPLGPNGEPIPQSSIPVTDNRAVPLQQVQPALTPVAPSYPQGVNPALMEGIPPQNFYQPEVPIKAKPIDNRKFLEVSNSEFPAAPKEIVTRHVEEVKAERNVEIEQNLQALAVKNILQVTPQQQLPTETINPQVVNPKRVEGPKTFRDSLTIEGTNPLPNAEVQARIIDRQIRENAAKYQPSATVIPTSQAPINPNPNAVIESDPKVYNARERVNISPEANLLRYVNSYKDGLSLQYPYKPSATNDVIATMEDMVLRAGLKNKAIQANPQIAAQQAMEAFKVASGQPIQMRTIDAQGNIRELTAQEYWDTIAVREIGLTDGDKSFDEKRLLLNSLIENSKRQRSALFDKRARMIKQGVNVANISYEISDIDNKIKEYSGRLEDEKSRRWSPNEAGFFTPGEFIVSAAQGLRNIKDRIGRRAEQRAAESAMKRQARKIKLAPGVEDPLPTVERYLMGQVSRPTRTLSRDYNVDLASVGGPIGNSIGDMIGAWRDFYVQEKTLAYLSLEYKPIHEIQEKIEEGSNLLQAQFANEMQDFSMLPSSSQQKIMKQAAVNRIIWKKHHKAPDESDAALAKLGLTPEEITGFRAVRRVSELSKGVIVNAIYTDQVAKGEDPVKINNIVANLKKQLDADPYYIPFSRRGEYVVYVEPTDTDAGYFGMFDSEPAAKIKADELKKAGRDAKKRKYNPRTVADTTSKKEDKVQGASDGDKLTNIYSELSPEMAATLAVSGVKDAEVALHNMGIPMDKFIASGFKGHFNDLIDTQLMAGFSLDLKYAMANYVSGLSNWAVKKENEFNFRKLIDGLPSGMEHLRQHAKDQYDKFYRVKPGALDDKLGMIRQLNALYMISKPMSAVANTTGLLVNTMPFMMAEMRKAGAKNPGASSTKLLGKSIWQSGRFLNYPDKFKQLDPELYNMLELKTQQGILAAQQSQQLMRMGKQTKESVFGEKGVTDRAMYLFGLSERNNRITSFIAFYNIAKQKGLVGEEAANYAERLVKNTNGDYSKANQGAIMRFAGGIPAQFMAYPTMYLSNLRNLLNEKEFKAAMAMLLLPFTLGGLFTVPFLKDILMASEMMGYDPKRAARAKASDIFGENVGEGVADFMLYGGVSSIFGVSLAGNLSFSELGAGLEDGVDELIMRRLMGPTGGIVTNLANASKLAGKGQYYMAAERALPKVISGPMMAARFASTGVLEDYQGNRNIKDPTVAELIGLAAGGQITRKSKESEQKRMIQLAKEANTGQLTKIIDQYARAYRDGDKTTMTELKQDLKTLASEGVNTASFASGVKSKLKGWKSNAYGAPKAAKDDIKEINKLLKVSK